MKNEKEEKYSFIETFNKFRSWKENHRENELQFHTHLAAIEEFNIWKKDEYYDSIPNPEFIKYKNYCFGDFLKKVFKLSITWFNRINEIKGLPNGKEFFIKYGYYNMVTYCRSTSEEKTKIIEYHNNYLGPITFNAIKRILFPKPGVAIVKGNYSSKNKYEELRVKYSKLRNKYMKLKIEAKRMESKYLKEIKHLKTKYENIKNTSEELAYYRKIAAGISKFEYHKNSNNHSTVM